MGSLAWGKGNAGELGPVERCRLVGNLAYVQLREVFDAARHRFGMLNPTFVGIDDLMPPQTALVEDALALAEETHQQPLLFHSWRTYFFGAVLAAHERIEHDRSLFFASAILHDLGLTEGHTPHLCDCCFALSGGARAQQHLSAKGHPPDVGSKIGDAIALHLNGWVSRRRHGAEAHLVARGAVCDLFGAGRRRMAGDVVAQLLQRFPRDGVIDALQFETAEHRKGTRPAIMTRMSGGKAPSDPFPHAPATTMD